MAAYRAGRTESDLWGWSCSDKADAIQEQFSSVVDFGKLCDTQVCSTISPFPGVFEFGSGRRLMGEIADECLVYEYGAGRAGDNDVGDLGTCVEEGEA